MIDRGDLVPSVGLYAKLMYAYCMIGQFEKAYVLRERWVWLKAVNCVQWQHRERRLFGSGVVSGAGRVCYTSIAALACPCTNCLKVSTIRFYLA